MYILHTFIKLKMQVLPSPEPPLLPYADLHLDWPISRSATTRLSLSGHSGLAFATGWFGYMCARSVRSWPAAGQSREAHRWRSGSLGRRARWVPAGSGAAVSAGFSAEALAARCCCRCWSFDSWGEFALPKKKLWLAGWVRAGSEAQQRQGDLKRRGVRAFGEILMAGSERHGEKHLTFCSPPYQTSYNTTVIS